MKEIRTERLTIVPFELKYLNDYYNGLVIVKKCVVNSKLN